jgi:hypothetical protein
MFCLHFKRKINLNIEEARSGVTSANIYYTTRVTSQRTVIFGYWHENSDLTCEHVNEL